MRKPKRSLIVAVTIGLAAGAGVVPVFATNPSSAGDTASTGDFGIFRRAPASVVPDEVRKFAADQTVQSRFGVDWTQAREAVPVTGSASRPWYVLPGTDGICFYDGSAGVCTTLRGAEQGRLFAVLVPAPSSAGSPPVDGSAPMTVRGVVPDGVTVVRAISTDGNSVDADVKDGAYAVTAANIGSIAFSGPGAPSAMPIGQ